MRPLCALDPHGAQDREQCKSVKGKVRRKPWLQRARRTMTMSLDVKTAWHQDTW